MNFLSKDYTIHLIDLLKLVLMSLGAGSLICMLYPDIGWILIMATIFIIVYWISELYQHYKQERKKK